MESWCAAPVPSLPGQGAGPSLKDTATGDLVPATSGRQASLYACGITPYDATHIGHAATYLAWDLLVRAWQDAGHDVTYVQNATDVDDPLLERAARDGEDWRALADREIARYRGDMQALRVLPPAHLVGAVEAMPIIERFARQLAERGALYEVESDQYFSRACDPLFGSVSGLDQATMITLFAERGGDPDRPGKKDPLDCLVWLAARPGEPSWESVFGRGRPGWHVECSAIATQYLGPVFDVQAGGSDLVFPHHELSASHARVALRDSRAFARRYAHAGMVRLDGEKMSKSRGNLVFVSALLAGGADPMAVRLALLAHHYRDDWDWTAEGLAAAHTRLHRWRAAVSRGLSAAAEPVAAGGPAAPAGRPWRPMGSAQQATGQPRPPGDAGRRGGHAAMHGHVATHGDAARHSGEGVLAAVRERLADDLDAPGALAAVDGWAGAVLSAGPPPPAATPAALVRDTADALLGVAL